MEEKVDNVMKINIRVFVLLVGLVFSCLNYAAIGDYKVVVIHGLQADQLKSMPDADQVKAEGEEYWQEYWLQYADERIDWPAYERVEEKKISKYDGESSKTPYLRNLWHVSK